MVDINDYREEKSCVYKDEEYLVRDNGAVLRKSRPNQRTRKHDNEWTFGTKNYENGYSYESNMSEGEFLLTLWDRNKTNERLINLNETIKTHFADFRIIKNNVAMSISYSTSLPVEEDNDDLKKQEIRLDVKYVKGE